MIYAYTHAPYPVIIIISLVCMLLLVYFLIRNYSKLDIGTIFFLIFLITDLSLLILMESLEKYQSFIDIIPAVRITFIVFLILTILALTKAGFRKAWEIKTTRNLIIFSGTIMFISIVLIAISLFLKNFE